MTSGINKRARAPITVINGWSPETTDKRERALEVHEDYVGTGSIKSGMVCSLRSGKLVPGIAANATKIYFALQDEGDLFTIGIYPQLLRVLDTSDTFTIQTGWFDVDAVNNFTPGAQISAHPEKSGGDPHAKAGQLKIAASTEPILGRVDSPARNLAVPADGGIPEDEFLVEPRVVVVNTNNVGTVVS